MLYNAITLTTRTVCSGGIPDKYHRQIYLILLSWIFGCVFCGFHTYYTILIVGDSVKPPFQSVSYGFEINDTFQCAHFTTTQCLFYRLDDCNRITACRGIYSFKPFHFWPKLISLFAPSSNHAPQ